MQSTYQLSSDVPPISRLRLKANLWSRRQLFGYLLTVTTAAITAIGIFALLSILLQITMHALPQLSLKVLLELPPPPGGEGGGFGNAIAGTVLMVLIGLTMSLPIAFFAGLYLAEFGKTSLLATALRETVELLNSAPSIVVGLFAYAIVVVLTGTFSALAGGFALSLIMLPTLVRAIEEGLRGVPDHQRFAAQAVGCTEVQTVWLVVLPQSMPSIVMGIILAVARASGESAPLLFTALFSQFWATKLMAPAPSLAVLIYNFAGSPFQNQQTLAWSAAFALVSMIMALNLAVRFVTNRLTNQTQLR